nr:transmembrane protein 53 [Quercus suber]
MANTDVPGFQSLAKDISLWRPRLDTDRSSTTRSLSLIIFCSWMGAAPKHIAKYTEAYKKQFPDAEILLVQSSMSTVLRGGLDMTAACSVVRSHLDPRNEQNAIQTASTGKILWHASSNGGAMTAVNLLRELQHQHSFPRLPPSAARLVLDCAPGKPEISGSVRAVMLQLPKSSMVFRLLATALVYAISVTYLLVYSVLRWDFPLTQTRRDLNNADRFFPHDAPRLYIYSKGDALVPWHHISEHVREARRLGYSAVKEEIFEKAQHCFLVAEDAKRYWDAVVKVVGN